MKLLKILTTLLMSNFVMAASDIKLSEAFTSKLGYSLSYPNCFSMTTAYPDDDIKKIESLSDIIFEPNSECPPETKRRIFSISLTPQYSKSPTHKNLDQIIKDAKINNQINGIQSLVAKLIGLKSGEAVLTIIDNTPKSLRWQVWIPCNDKMFRFETTMKDDAKAKSDFIAIIKKDPNFIPEPEKTVIESFRCNVK